VIGGLGSITGAIWGAALLVLLPGWSNDIGNSFSLSSNVQNNLPLAFYGVVLIIAMLAWPSGIQGGVRAAGRWATRAMNRRRGAGRPASVEVD
jgi:branched-chain amino acid transport system permease protein